MGLPSRSKSGLTLLIHMYRLNSDGTCGGYRTRSSLSIQLGTSMTVRRCVKQSKDARPWYEPVPDSPTPPKGSVGIAPWNQASLMVAPPDVTWLRTAGS